MDSRRVPREVLVIIAVFYIWLYAGVVGGLRERNDIQIRQNNAFFYEEKFKIISTSYDLRYALRTCRTVKTKTEEMMKKKLDIDMTFGHDLNLQAAVGHEILSRIDSICDPIEEHVRELTRVKRWDAAGEAIHWATGVPGPEEFRHAQEAIMKINSIVDLLNSNQNKTQQQMQLLMEIQVVKQKAFKKLAEEVEGEHNYLA